MGWAGHALFVFQVPYVLCTLTIPRAFPAVTRRHDRGWVASSCVSASCLPLAGKAAARGQRAAQQGGGVGCRPHTCAHCGNRHRLVGGRLKEMTRGEGWDPDGSRGFPMSMIDKSCLLGVSSRGGFTPERDPQPPDYTPQVKPCTYSCLLFPRLGHSW